MNEAQNLRYSFALSLCAFILFCVAAVIVMSNGGNVGQEQFEVLGNAKDYSQKMNVYPNSLRWVLAVDSVFILCYAGAIGFAVAAFYHRNKPFAAVTGLLLLIVVFLDNWENAVMVQSIDLVSLNLLAPPDHLLSVDQMMHQVTISSLKWQFAALMLFVISFVLPNDSLVEKLLVWGTRLGLAVAVPLFIFIAPKTTGTNADAIDFRALGQLLIALSMSSGFVLLALVTRARAKAI